MVTAAKREKWQVDIGDLGEGVGIEEKSVDELEACVSCIFASKLLRGLECCCLLASHALTVQEGATPSADTNHGKDSFLSYVQSIATSCDIDLRASKAHIRRWLCNG
jgi:hypothetical protein